MSANGVIWLSGFSLLVGVALAAAPRFWQRRLVAAWYLWLGGVGLSALIVGQVVVALVRTGHYRLEDPGPAWLALPGFDLAMTMDPTATYGAAGVLGLVLFSGALLTQVGMRLDGADRSALARLAWVAGGACLVMSARSLVLILAGWTICARAMAGGRVDRRARAWFVLGDLGIATFVLALMFGAGVRDLQGVSGFDLSAVLTPIASFGSHAVTSSELAVMGLALAVVARVIAPTGAWSPSGGAGPYAITRAFAGAVVPWVVLCLRFGRVFAHAPWGMVVVTVAGIVLVVGGALRCARPGASAPARVVGYARACAGVPVLAVGLGHADLAMFSALIGAGNAVTFALAGGHVPMRGLGRWAAWAWLGIAPFSAFAVNVQAIGWARGHDSAASMGINWLAWSALLLAWAWLALGLARARRDVHDSASGVEQLRLGSRAALVWGLITWPLVWPLRWGATSWLGDKLGLHQSYGLVFSQQLRDQYVGLRPEFVDPDTGLASGAAAVATALAAAVPVAVYTLAPRWPREHRLLRGASRLELKLAQVPAWGVGMAGALIAAVRRVLVELVPALARNMTHALEQGLAWGPTLRARAGGRGARWARVPWGACLLVLVVLGWLYFKPSVVHYGPSEFHGFGGIDPRLRRAVDPSVERARARARAQASGSPSTAGGEGSP